MSIFTIAGLIVATWAMLSVMGSERQQGMVECRRRVELEAASAPPAPAAAHPPAATKHAAPAAPGKASAKTPPKPPTPAARAGTAKPR